MHGFSPSSPHSIQSVRLSVQSSELGPPPPHPEASVAPPPLSPMGETHSPCGGGGGGTLRTAGQKVWCSVYYNPFTPLCYIKTKNMTSRIDSCKGYDKLTLRSYEMAFNRLYFDYTFFCIFGIFCFFIISRSFQKATKNTFHRC
jgi:hypothetical protein